MGPEAGSARFIQSAPGPQAFARPAPVLPGRPAMIEVKGVSKWYVFRRRVLDSVQLTVEPGDMFGLIGPNGAGKTTLIRILATVLKPSEGTATIDGLRVTQDAG